MRIPRIDKIFLISILLLLMVYSAFLQLLKYSSSADIVADVLAQKINSKQLLIADFDKELQSLVVTHPLDEENLKKDFFINQDFFDIKHSIRIFHQQQLLCWNNTTFFPDHLLNDSLKNGVLSDSTSGNVYMLRKTEIGKYLILSFDLIYEYHNYSNEFIHVGFNKAYGSFTSRYQISSSKDEGVKVLDPEKNPYFSIQPIGDDSETVPSVYVISLFLLLSLVLVLLYIYLYFIINKITGLGRWKWKWIVYSSAILIIQFALRISGPQFFFVSSGLFQPSAFSSGLIFPSLGFLLLHSQALLAITIVVRSQIQKSIPIVNRKFLLIKGGVLLGGILALFLFHAIWIESVFFQTSVPLTFSKFFLHTAWSYAVFISVALITLAIIFLISAGFDQLRRYHLTRTELFLLTIINLAVFAILIYIIEYQLYILIAFTGSVLFYHLTTYSKRLSARTGEFDIHLGLFFIFSLMLTAIIYHTNQIKTAQTQQLTARQLSIEQDPVFEFLWADTRKQLLQDKEISNLLFDSTELTTIPEEKLRHYFVNNYYTDYYRRFDVELTACNASSQLLVQPQNMRVLCSDYFDELIRTRARPSSQEGLYLIDDEIQGMYYIAVLPYNDSFASPTPQQSSIYIEFYYKFIPEGLGYPELLIDESKGISKEFANYSFAIYNDSILVYKFGNFLYPTRYEKLNKSSQEAFNLNEYRHVVQQTESGKTIVLSVREKSLAVALAPFSFFFLLLTVPGLMILLLLNYGSLFSSFNFTFRFKLQVLILSSLLLSFIIIGFTTTYYITNVYNKKNDDFLFEKTQSILIELEHKLKNEDISIPDLREYLHQLLLKFSLVFFSDINIFDLQGRLIASSRYDIFDQQLIAEQINPMAYQALRFDEKLYFMHEEQIGTSAYLSSYIPFKNENGEVLAYINLPYFARETEMRNEISSLILTYLNLFLVISAIVVLFVLLLSRRLLVPLQMIQEKMRLIRIDRVNEKISWKSKDELGQFVNQYNALIDELAESAERLARSERESAWREMAKQVAHEIKNPLTPMRLSVQYLLRAWHDKDPEIDQKIRNTSETIINQIDTLSSIASAFSDFARMPANNTGETNLIQLIKNLVVLFDNHANITFKIEVSAEKDILIRADQAQMNRVFTNLIKNSIQAIGDKPAGLIHIHLTLENHFALVSLSDNGKGMTEAESGRVFSPNFTTKTSGMGIGLAMVYNLVTTAEGSIEFKTTPGKGTTFYLRLPLHS